MIDIVRSYDQAFLMGQAFMTAISRTCKTWAYQAIVSAQAVDRLVQGLMSKWHGMER